MLQDFIIDAWTLIKQNLLRYFTINQDMLCPNVYQRLANIFGDMQNQEVDIKNLKQKLILLLFHIVKDRNSINTNK